MCMIPITVCMYILTMSVSFNLLLGLMITSWICEFCPSLWIYINRTDIEENDHKNIDLYYHCGSYEYKYFCKGYNVHDIQMDELISINLNNDKKMIMREKKLLLIGDTCSCDVYKLVNKLKQNLIDFNKYDMDASENKLLLV
eukprot:160285_1